MGTKIEWATETWNPVVGCTKVSEGCRNCYAERMAVRLAAMGHEKYQKVVSAKAHSRGGKQTWAGGIYCDKKALDQPLHWHNPRQIFVCSMGDLFHESVPFEFIDKVMTIIALTKQHTHLILTKRIGRAKKYFAAMSSIETGTQEAKRWDVARKWLRGVADSSKREYIGVMMAYQQWPFKNLWLGVTCENQQRADERIPTLLQIPAEHRFVSLEPLLEKIDFGRIVSDPQLSEFTCSCKARVAFVGDYYPERGYKAGKHFDPNDPGWETCCSKCGCEKYRWNIDLVIVGAETGPKARYCPLDWIESVADQCKAAGVKVFVKAVHLGTPEKFKISKKMSEWPENIRVRDLPF